MVLSLDTRSDQVQEFECSRQELLGYGRAEFLLACWFTPYPGPSREEGTQIRFPTKASEKLEGLAHLLLGWLEGDGEDVRPGFSPANAAPRGGRYTTTFIGYPWTFEEVLELT